MSDPSATSASTRRRAARPSAYSELGAGVALAASIVAPHAAHADAPQECSAAYDSTQVLRDAGNIDAALVEAAICTRDVCAKFIRDDCSTWKADLEARQSTVSIQIVDASGGRVTKGSATLDGAPWLDDLGGGPRPIAKGLHTLEVRTEGVAPYKKSITIAEGVKDRKVSFTIAQGDAEDGASGLVLVDADAPPPAKRTNLLVPGVAVGVAGMAIGVTGGVLLGFAANKATEIKRLCGEAPPTCKGSSEDAKEASALAGDGKQLEIAGATLVGVGAVGAAIGLTMVLLEVGRKPKNVGAPTLVPGARFARGEGALWLHGTF